MKEKKTVEFLDPNKHHQDDCEILVGTNETSTPCSCDWQPDSKCLFCGDEFHHLMEHRCQS